MKDADLIKRAGFFSELPESDLEQIASISVERKVRKNMILFMEGDAGEAFYYVKAGKVKIYRIYEDGREHIVHILAEGDVFGEVTLFNGIPYPASASVYEDAVIGVIKNRDLEKLVQGNSEFALRLIKNFIRSIVTPGPVFAYDVSIQPAWNSFMGIGKRTCRYSIITMGAVLGSAHMKAFRRDVYDWNPERFRGFVAAFLSFGLSAAVL